MKKIGIFAGTFDPIHEGHLAFAHAGLSVGLEKIMFLPEPRPRRKQGVRALEHRIAMVQLATAETPQFSTIVLQQARFTAHETLPLLQARFPDYKLVLLFGDDVIVHIAGWPHVDSLVKSTELLIASRNHKRDALISKLKTLEQTKGLKFKYKIIEPSNEEVASSKIRLGIKHNQAVNGLPRGVFNYITEHQLYSSTT